MLVSDAGHLQSSVLLRKHLACIFAKLLVEMYSKLIDQCIGFENNKPTPQVTQADYALLVLPRISESVIFDCMSVLPFKGDNHCDIIYTHMILEYQD